MATDTDTPNQERKRTKVVYKGASSAPIYGLGLIGAWVYYIGQATTFWIGVLGILKGIVWPAMLAYELMKYLGM